MSLRNLFAQGSTTWTETVKRAGTFENPPDGRYIMQLATAELGENSKNLAQIKWGWAILEPDLAGTTKYEYMQLEGKLGMDPFAWRLNSLGLKLEDLQLEGVEDLKKLLAALTEEGFVVDAQLATKDGFQNIRIQKLLTEYDAPQIYTNEGEGGGGPVEPAGNPSVEPVKEPEGTPAPTPAPEAKSEPDPDGGTEEYEELKKGMKVAFLKDGVNVTGKVTEVDNDNETAMVKVGLSKPTKVKFEDLEIVEEGLDG